MSRAALALLLVLACKSGGTSAPPKNDGDTATDDATTEGATADGDTPTSGKRGPKSRCNAMGRPWDGKPEGCAYEHDGCCYDAAEPACAAAGCEGPQCIVMESYPAQVRCDE